MRPGTRARRGKAEMGTYDACVSRDEHPDDELGEPGEDDGDEERVDGPQLVRGEADEDAPDRGGDVEHCQGQREHLHERACAAMCVSHRDSKREHTQYEYARLRSSRQPSPP